jgi:glucokinase
MHTFKEVEYIKSGYDSKKLLLVGDIGGTYSNFAIFEAGQPLRLIISLHFLSKEIASFLGVVRLALEHLEKKYDIKVDKACFAGAGPVRLGVIHVTNLPWNIDVNELKKGTSLKSIKIINDFEAIGYGIDLIDQKNVVCICEGVREKKLKKLNKIVIGAGTGLGKCTLTWSDNKNDYVVIPSEGGHSDLPVYNQEEFMLLEYIKKIRKKDVVAWIDILSGEGISTIYKFLLESNRDFVAHDDIVKSNYEPKIIVAHKEIDSCAMETLKWFVRFYGRCAKNFALEVLALDGVYIAGGIAAKNPDIFRSLDGSSLLLSEFLKNEKMKFLLEKIPIYLVLDYNVSLHGAAKSYLC